MRPPIPIFYLSLFFVFLASPICLAYDNPQDCACAQSVLECGVNSECITTCNYGVGTPVWTTCLQDNPDFCPAPSSDIAACWLAFHGRIHCTCVAGITSCHLKTSTELQAGGTCKISGGGIALAVVVPSIIIAAIGWGVYLWCRPNKSAQNGNTYQQLEWIKLNSSREELEISLRSISMFKPLASQDLRCERLELRNNSWSRVYSFPSDLSDSIGKVVYFSHFQTV